MPVLKMPQLRMQVISVVNERANAGILAENGYMDVIGGHDKPVLLNVSAVSIHPTVCGKSIKSDQIVLNQELNGEMFQFPAATYEFEHQPHLGLALTLYINKSTVSVEHCIAAVAYVNYDVLMTGQATKVRSSLNDVNNTPVHIVLQALITQDQVAWNQQNADLLKQLCNNFHSIDRVQQRLIFFSEERYSALSDFLDPHNKNTLHTTLGMTSNGVRHVMNVNTVDNEQAEFFKQACVHECPDYLMKYAPLSAAMLLTTAVKFLQLKHGSTTEMSYKHIADSLSNMRWTKEDAESWTQIFCNCMTSIVPACNTYTGDASWLVDSDGVRVIPKLVGEEQLLLGAPLVQAVQDMQNCQHLSGKCREMCAAGDLQKAELFFHAAHEARLRTTELGKNQDCEDFTADMRNLMAASSHTYVMTTTAEKMIGTALLCSDARLNAPRNTLCDAQQALLVCCSTQRHIMHLIEHTCQDCVCIAAGANLTSKYGTTMDEKRPVVLTREMFADRDAFLLATTPGAAGHACRLRCKSSKMQTIDMQNGVRMHVHDTNVLCMQESTSSTILQDLHESDEKFDVEVQVGLGTKKTFNGMTKSTVRNVTGSIYGDMLTNAGLAAHHAADRMATQDFYKVICAVGGRTVLSAERGPERVSLSPAEMLSGMLSKCTDTHYYLGAQNHELSSMMCLEFELKPEEQKLLRLLARAQAPLYCKPIELVLQSGGLGTCFFPKLQNISAEVPGIPTTNTAKAKQLYVVAQKTPFLTMSEVLQSKSVDTLLNTQTEHVRDVLKETCRSQFNFKSDQISTDIMLLHTELDV